MHGKFKETTQSAEEMLKKTLVVVANQTHLKAFGNE